MFKSITVKVMIGYAAILALLVATSIVLIAKINTIDTNKSEFIEQTQPALDLIDSTSKLFNQVTAS